MTDTTARLRDHLHALIAAAAQREYEDSITNADTVAHPDHLGSRIAAEILNTLAPNLTYQWSVRHPGGIVDSRQFTGEAAARQWADTVGGEVVYRPVGEWIQAQVRP